jgi:hypothetical protein
MKVPILSLGDNVLFLNKKAQTYHYAIKTAQDDLYLIFCLDLWSEPRCATKQAVEAFVARFKGKSIFMIVPIDPIMAAEMADEFLVAEDIQEIDAKP